MGLQKRETRVICPRNPDHGEVGKRWLPQSERERITSDSIADVFEIDCPHCGKYEVSER